MQPVQYRLQTRQDRTIKLDGERALQARLVLRLLEQILQLEEFDLQMQLPMNQKKSVTPASQRRPSSYLHRHELLNGIVQPSRKQRRLFGRVFLLRLCDIHRILGRERIGRDETRV